MKYKSTIENIKQHIKLVYPDAKDVTVRVKKVRKGKVDSLIKVTAPQSKPIVARKRDSNFHLSLEKTEAAILKQIEKRKSKKQRSSPLKQLQLRQCA